MSLFGKNRAVGLMDVIRCDEPSYIIWKWKPTISELQNRENAVRLGSSLRVKESEVAVFVSKQKNGLIYDYIEGPFDGIISTKNLPIITDIIGLAYDGESPFQAEIYFINLAKIIQIKFGVPFFEVYDPRFLDFGVPVAVRGTISFSISDYRAFIKLHRLTEFTLDAFQRQVRDAVSRYVKDVVANAPAANNIPIVQLETKTSLINDAIELYISDRLKDNFGVDVSSVDIGAIEIDKASEGYRQLMAVTRDITIEKVQAEKIDYVERLRIQREEEQYAKHKATQTANIGAVQLETQAEIGLAGANALSNIGASGIGNVDLGGNSGVGFNPIAMMAGVTLGGAVGHNIAGAMNGIVSNPVQPTQMTPPPIPEAVYNVAQNGKPTGPYSISSLIQMAQTGQIKADTLVWKPGMNSWSAISAMAELSDVLSAIPPDLPLE